MVALSDALGDDGPFVVFVRAGLDVSRPPGGVPYGGGREAWGPPA